MIEKYLNLYSYLYGIQTCSVRLSNSYGPYQRVDSAQGAVTVFCYRALNNEPIHIWGDGTIRRDFVYIDDVIDALLKLLNDNNFQGVINIGSGTSKSLNEILDLIQEIIGRKVIKVYEKARKFDVPETCLDISKAKTVLNWEPKVDILEGLRYTIECIGKQK